VIVAPHGLEHVDAPRITALSIHDRAHGIGESILGREQKHGALARGPAIRPVGAGRHARRGVERHRGLAGADFADEQGQLAARDAIHPLPLDRLRLDVAEARDDGLRARRDEWRRGLGERLQLLAGMSGVEPVRGITFRGQPRKLELFDSQAGRRAGRHHRLGVGASGVIVIRDDHDLGHGGRAERGGVLWAPLAGAAVVARGGETQAGEPVAVLLAFADEDARMLRELGQPIGDDRDALEIPDPPAALAVRAATPKILRGEPHDLVEEGVARVAIVVGRHHPRRSRTVAVVSGGREVGERHRHGPRDLVRGAAPVAFHQRPAIGADPHGQRALLLVGVGGAEREPPVAGGLDAAEPIEDRRARHGCGHSTTGPRGAPAQKTSMTRVMPDGLPRR
jgi:hypothetical protein